MTDDNAFLIDYYQGAYGPTLRIDTQSPQALAQFKEVMLKLGHAELQTVEFHQAVAVRQSTVKGLTLRLLSEQSGVMTTVRLKQITLEGPVFDWARSTEGWLECAGLLDGLLEGGGPGHQYLSREDIDDALIELAFRESIETRH